MNIELTKTTVKLTKSIVNQMMSASLKQMQEGEVLGFVVNVVKDAHKEIMIKDGGNYFRLACGWRKGGIREVLRSAGKKGANYILEFNLAEERETWWAAYQKCLEKATTQIFV